MAKIKRSIPSAFGLQHIEEGANCWCLPRVFKLCPEDCKQGCWNCSDGRIECDPAEMEWDTGTTFIIVHNDR